MTIAFVLFARDRHNTLPLKIITCSPLVIASHDDFIHDKILRVLERIAGSLRSTLEISLPINLIIRTWIEVE